VSSLFSHLISKDIFSKISSTDLLRAIDSLNESGQGGQVLLSMPSPLGEVTLADVDKDDYRWYVKSGRVIAERVDIAPGASGLIINGRVRFAILLLVSNRDVSRLQIIGPITSGEFTAEDFQMLQDYELAKRVQPVLSALEDVVPTFIDHDR
jgi:UDP-glucose:glycoprotein glucosyltransferase